MRENKKGFISMSLIFSFFILFIIILLAILGSYANNRLMVNRIKEQVKKDLGNKATPKVTIWVDTVMANDIPENNGVYLYQKLECDKEDVLVWDNASWSISGLDQKIGAICNIYFITKPGDENFEYKGTEDPYVVTVDGYYKIELWGAGVNSRKGAYTKGEVYLRAGETLYFQIGGSNGYNGGGGGAQNGAGASDVRLTSGVWNGITLRSRIMVASGSGYSANGNGVSGTGSNQTSGNAFGVGANYSSYTNENCSTSCSEYCDGSVTWCCTNPSIPCGCSCSGTIRYNCSTSCNPYTTYTYAGGGGWYGGTSSYGGSSFVSGFVGCNAVNAITGAHTGTTYYYEQYQFSNVIVTAGGGNTGNGSGKISFLRSEQK